MSDYKDKEALVNQYAAQNKLQDAINLLYEMICSAVQAKDFERAEAFRDLIYDIDSMALVAIVKANELIENSKRKGIDKAHKEVWHKLYSRLTDEEATAIFYALEEKTYDSYKIILKQGEANPYLFFVDSGLLTVSCNIKGKVLFIKNIKGGHIAGEDTFFSASICTNILSSDTVTNLHCLHKKNITKWKTKFPRLESKLKDFCYSPEQHCDVFKNSKRDRRVHKRMAIDGSINFNVLKPSGDPIEKTFRGKLSDISKGGISFFIKTGQEETANLLLGKKLRLLIKDEGDILGRGLDQNGIVMAVQFHPLMSPSANDYSIHMKYDKDLTNEIFDQIKEFFDNS